jgi:two-component system LytT family response regulator
MSKIGVVIVDDEPKAREVLKQLCEDYFPDLKVLAIAGSVKEGYDAIKKHQPKIVFLDVEMPPSTGFDLLEMFDEINFNVIFTTAFGHYAIQAIRFSALDYLLKPISISELRSAVKRFKPVDKDQKVNNVKTLLHNLNGQNDIRLALSDYEGVNFIELNKILRFEADSNYTKVYMDNNSSYLITRTLKEFEELLSDHNFYRVHMSHIINMERMKRYDKRDGGVVIMSDNSEIQISKRRKAEFLEKIGVR